MGKKDAPKAPDPQKTAAAQTGTNISTAIANTLLNNANQVGPDGTISYSTSGYETITDPSTGKSYQIPRQTATTTLSPQQQAIKNQTDAAQLNLGSLANQQSAFLKDYMAKPFDGSNEAVEARLWELGRTRLDPMMAQQDDQLATRLANQGIQVGSTAWDRAMSQQGQNRNDAYNSLLLQGRGQAFNEALATRSQPINEITALLSGSQVSNPQAAGFNGAQIPTTDYAGLVGQNYQQQLAAHQQKGAFGNSVLGGLFGLGSAAILASDRRVKTDISKVGETNDNQPIYAYRYKAGGPMQLGLMAQDVEKRRPEAVTTVGGVKHVDYRKALQLGKAA